MGIQMLVPLGREKVVLYSEIAGALVDLVINLILIPRMASAGAAIGTLVAEIVVWIVQFIALRVDVTEAYRRIWYGKILFAIALGIIASIWIKWMQGSVCDIGFSSIIFLECILLSWFWRKNHWYARLKTR